MNFNCEQLVAAAARHVSGPPVTATYASAGSDTRGLSFLHPGFLASRGLADVPAPNVFFHIDREAGWEDYYDEATSILATSRTPLDGQVIQLIVKHDSERYGSRDVVVYTVLGENELVAADMATQGWAPDLFIGVTDGCRFGGNRHCVNNLGAPLPRSAARLFLPRYWVSDHFTDADIPATLAEGDYISSASPAFPVRFLKRALLSTAWGRYGRGTLGGATLFEVVPAPAGAHKRAPPVVA